MEDKKKLLIDFIKNYALIRRPLVLSSGKKSTYYIDCRMVLTHPVGIKLVSDLIEKGLEKEEISVVGGVELGSIPLLGILSLHGYRTFIIRKERKKHGLQKSIEGWILPTDKKVAVIDDVITTGASILSAINRLRAEYPNIKQIVPFCIVNRQENNNITYHSLITAEDLCK